MEGAPDVEDYWNTSSNKAFNFDDQDEGPQLEVHHNRLIAEDNISEASFEIQTNEMPLQMLISEEDLKRILGEQSMEENPIRKGTSPEDELRMLRRMVKEFASAPPPEITANRLLLGKICSLEAYKALQDKERLLDEVIESGSGSAILQVVLFLAKTLNKKQFNRLLLQRSEACNHYLNYLVTRMKVSEATDLLTMLGRDQEAAILQFRVAMQVNADPQMKKQRLKKVYSDYFTQPGIVPLYSQIVGDAINLLEWQLLEKSTCSGNSNIVDCTPLQTLYYLCSKHKWKESKDTKDMRNPYKFIIDHNITSAHFEWTALNERAKSQAYLDLDGLFEKSSWHSVKQKQFHINIPIEVAILRLHALKAPPAVLNSFLSKVSDPNKKLALAKEVKAIRSIVDALVALKEKQELEQYRDTLTEGSEERFYAENSLKNLGKKWSTEGIRLIKN